MISILLRYHSQTPIFWIIILIIIVASAIYGFFFSRSAFVRRKIRKTGGKRISEFQSGEIAKAVGTIKYVGTPLIAPLSGRKCCHYYVHVEELRSNGKTSSYYTLFEDEKSAHVVVKDGNNYAYIETKTALTHLIQDRQYNSGFWNDASKNLVDYLAERGYKTTSWIGMNKGLKYSEGILEEGELVAVVGKGTWKIKRELNIDIPVERILVLSGDEKEPIYFSDDPEVANNET